MSLSFPCKNTFLQGKQNLISKNVKIEQAIAFCKALVPVQKNIFASGTILAKKHFCNAIVFCITKNTVHKTKSIRFLEKENEYFN